MPFGVRSTQVALVTGASVKFTNAMKSGQQYIFTCSVDCWVKVTATTGAAVPLTSDNQLYIAGQVLRLQSTGVAADSFVHAIKDDGQPDGRASLGLEES